MDVIPSAEGSAVPSTSPPRAMAKTNCHPESSGQMDARRKKRWRPGQNDKWTAPERRNCRSLGFARDDKGEHSASIGCDGGNDSLTGRVYSSRNLPQASQAAQDDDLVPAVKKTSQTISRLWDLFEIYKLYGRDFSPAVSSVYEPLRALSGFLQSRALRQSHNKASKGAAVCAPSSCRQGDGGACPEAIRKLFYAEANESSLTCALMKGSDFSGISSGPLGGPDGVGKRTFHTVDVSRESSAKDPM